MIGKRSTLGTAVVISLMQEAEAQRSSGGNGGAAKPPKFSKREIDVDQGTVTFVFGDGQDVTYNPFELPEEMQRMLTLHGMSQKGGDSFAGVKGNFGLARTNLQEVWDELKQGNWRSTGDERPRLGELAEAISRIKGTDLEKTKAAVEKATDEQRKAWRSNAQVKAMIAKLRAEKAAQALEAAGDQPLDIAVEG